MLALLVSAMCACGSRTELALASVTSTDVYPGAAQCPGVSTMPHVLTDLDADRGVTSLVIRGDHVYYGVSGGDASPAIYRVSLEGGSPELVVDREYDGGTIAIDDDYLYFSGPMMGMHAFARNGGMTLSLDPSMSGGAPYTHAIVTNGGRGVFWGGRSFQGEGGMAIEHWDPSSSEKPETVVTDADLAGFFVDRSSVYFIQRDGTQRTIASQPLAGGASTALATFSDITGDTIIQLIGLDPMHVVYTPSELGGDIRRVDKVGGDDTVLVKNVSFNGARFVDDAWVYWSGHPDPSLLLRAPLVGAVSTAPEKLFVAPSSHIDAVTADDCHVVWAVAQPPQLLLRAR